MADFNITITGLDDLLHKLDSLGELGKVGVGQALYEEAEKIMTDSKDNYVPVDTGTLRDSGVVEQPEEDDAGNVSVTMGYGGPAAPYAIYVHEIPAPPDQSPGGRSATHTVGQWKYLEVPAMEAAPGIPDAITEKLEPMIESIAGGGSGGLGGG